MFALAMTSRNLSIHFRSLNTTPASAVFRTISLSPSSFTVRPSIFWSRSSRSVAPRSTTRRRIASLAVSDRPFRTASSAQSALRPRKSASPRILATASLITLFRRSPSISPPPALIGVAAPIFVAGAMAAIWLA